MAGHAGHMQPLFQKDLAEEFTRTFRQCIELSRKPTIFEQQTTKVQNCGKALSVWLWSLAAWHGTILCHNIMDYTTQQKINTCTIIWHSSQNLLFGLLGLHAVVLVTVLIIGAWLVPGHTFDWKWPGHAAPCTLQRFIL